MRQERWGIELAKPMGRCYDPSPAPQCTVCSKSWTESNIRMVLEYHFSPSILYSCIMFLKLETLMMMILFQNDVIWREDHNTLLLCVICWSIPIEKEASENHPSLMKFMAFCSIFNQCSIAVYNSEYWWSFICWNFVELANWVKHSSNNISLDVEFLFGHKEL